MGGKTSTTTSGVSIPPSVLAQYQSVNAKAAQTANTPFQSYGGEFVAPVNTEQYAGIIGTNEAANEAQPYFGAATGTLGATQSGVVPINTAAENATAASASPLTAGQINQYLSPYLQTVLGSTETEINQQNQQAQAGQVGDAIRSGAFGGDRTGIAAANLAAQQEIAAAPIYSGIANTGYQSALSTAQGQQQIGLAGAAQLANIGSTAYGEGANTASELAQLGTGAQGAGLAGAQAQIGAGTVEQQTQQAKDAALYNQFLQQQSYPFQVDQFLANIAEGTGALSGSTTTTTQPGGFFSDRRLKRDVRKVGRTFDGQDVVTYKMGDDDRTRIGLIAQDVEKKHPRAVGLAGGFKVVDYGKATEKAANQGHFHAGGVVPFRRKRQDGGGLSGVLEAQRQMYGNMPGGGSQRQINQSGVAGARSLPVANAPASPPPSGSSELSQTMGLANQGYKTYKNFAGPGTTSFTPAASSTTLGDTSATALPSVDAAVAGSDAAGVAGAAGETAAGSAIAAGGTDVAAGSLAGAAAGAAGTAAAGAGTAAAADAAAALAAEYALADAAVVAAVAAARGGRIEKNGGGGAVPYLESGSDPSGDLNIPEQANTNTLHAAPGAGKIPTGMQQMMQMANPTSWGTTAGEVFSNQALALGGAAGDPNWRRPMLPTRGAPARPPVALMGARRGFDGGGEANPEDSFEDPDIDASVGDANVTASGPPAAPGAGTGVAPAQPSSFWDKARSFVESPEGLAALRAIGTMGTAKTVHPGVALAAGLGAGAEAYPEAREQLAHAQLTEAQAGLAGVRSRLAQEALNTPASPPPYQTADTSASPATAPAQDDSQTAAGIDKTYRDKYYVNPAQYTPQEWAAQQKGVQMKQAGLGDAYLNQATFAHQNRVQQAQAANQNAAQHEADGLYAQATDPNASYAARQSALVRYNALHQWTGDTYDATGGNKQNVRTGAPAIGIAAPQLTPQQRVELLRQAVAPVDVPNSDGTTTRMQTWQAPWIKAPNAQAYANLLGNFAASGTPPPSGPVATAAAGAPGAPGPAAPVRPPAAPPVTPAAPAAPPAAPMSYDERAMADQSFRLKKAPVVAGTTQAPAALEAQTAMQAKARQVLSDADAVTGTTAQSLQFMRAAQSIMQSKGATVGLYGGLISQASRILGGTPDSTNYQQLAKYLGNAAAQTAQATFPNATQKEVGMQFEQLSPNVQQNDDTINHLLANNVRAANYVIDSARRMKTYIGDPNNPTNDPNNFEKWNQQYYPREKIVNASQIHTNPDGSRLYNIGTKANPQWVR